MILADEVGLGKTIEAGLVLAQRWAERRRRILLIVPASLRKQWQEELRQKFELPSMILDGHAASAERASGRQRLFDRQDEIVIASYQFAAARADEVSQIAWDLVVFDEAHRLRNIYKPGSRIASALRAATAGRQKLLLTATPLQNSLLELYGLASFLDPHLFGDERSFREQFGGGAGLDAARASLLRSRLRGAITRTLRSQVLEYVRFTNRIPITQDFRPSDAEQLGAASKAVVFTESRRTQEYLVGLLRANGYEGRVVQLNGSNSDAH